MHRCQFPQLIQQSRTQSVLRGLSVVADSDSVVLGNGLGCRDSDFVVLGNGFVVLETDSVVVLGNGLSFFEDDLVGIGVMVVVVI